MLMPKSYSKTKLIIGIYANIRVKRDVCGLQVTENGFPLKRQSASDAYTVP